MTRLRERASAKGTEVSSKAEDVAMSMNVEPIYTPLSEDNDGFEFRRLEILEASTNKISCRLSKAAFIHQSDSIPSYIAISYVWGEETSADGIETITLNGRPWPVTKNLASALRHVGKHWDALFNSRKEDADDDKDTACLDATPSRYFWVDALCINQEDLTERARQVLKMGVIFGRAQTVFAWLAGEEEDEMVSLAMDTIRLLFEASTNPGTTEEEMMTLEWMQRRPQLMRDDGDVVVVKEGRKTDYPPRWDSLCSLFSLPYWSRVWIFQEVVLARHMYFVCPSSILPWDYLRQASSVMTQTKRIVDQYSVRKPPFMSNECWGIMRLPMINWSRVEMISHVRKHLGIDAGNGGGKGGSPRVHLGAGYQPLLYDPVMSPVILALNISTTGGNLQARDPKDHIYGLLGLTQLDMTPDYRTDMSYIDVYCEYVSRIISKYPPTTAREENGLLISFDELWFLRWAGTLYEVPGGEDGLGENGTREERHRFPSWAPNYPQSGEQRRGPMDRGGSPQTHVRLETICSDRSWAADSGVFEVGEGQVPLPGPVIGGRSLKAVGVVIRRISRMGATLDVDIEEAQRGFQEYCFDIHARWKRLAPPKSKNNHKKKKKNKGQQKSDENGLHGTVVRYPLLQALFRVWLRSSRPGGSGQTGRSDGCSYTSSDELAGFLQFLFFQTEKSTSDEEIYNLSRRLGRGDKESFDGWVCRTFSPGIRDMATEYEEGQGGEVPEQQDWLAKARDRKPLGEPGSDGLLQHGWMAVQLRKAGAQFFETDGGEPGHDYRLGLAPRGTRQGDLIAVLKGYSIPVIIRKMDNHHAFIGTCFVLGYMDGEARVQIDRGHAHIEMFEFR